MNKQTKLYVNDRLLLTIENLDDLRLDNEGEDKLDLRDYLIDIIDSNLAFDGIYDDFDFVWDENKWET